MCCVKVGGFPAFLFLKHSPLTKNNLTEEKHGRPDPSPVVTMNLLTEMVMMMMMVVVVVVVIMMN